MAKTREQGILKEITPDNYQDRNGNHGYTGKVEVNGSIITISVFSKSENNYPIAIGQRMFFDIDWSEMKNNKYKGDYYRIFGVKNEQKEAEGPYQGRGRNQQSSYDQPRTSNTPPPPPVASNKPTDIDLRIESFKSAIQHYINQSENIPENKLKHEDLFTLSKIFYEEYFSKFRDINFKAVKSCMEQALMINDLNDYLLSKVNNKDTVISMASAILVSLYPEVIENTNKSI